MIIVIVLAFLFCGYITLFIMSLADYANDIGFAIIGGLLGVVITQLAFVLNRLKEIQKQNNDR